MLLILLSTRFNILGEVGARLALNTYVLSNALSSANYATLVTAGNGGGTGQTTGQNYQTAAPTSSSVTLYCATNGVGFADPAYSGQMNCVIFR